MGIFPEFGGWINHKTQQPHKAESERSGNIKSRSMSEIRNQEERNEVKEQLQIWRDAEKKEQWHSPPAKVKMEETNNSLQSGTWSMDIEFILGMPPEAAYDVLTNPHNQSFPDLPKDKNISSKVMSPDSGKGQFVEAKKAVAWNFLFLSGAIPIKAVFMEHRQFHKAYISIKNKMFIKAFDGNYEIKPLYLDAERLCKHKKPKSREEYSECSDGQGRIASNVKLVLVFIPSSFFNVPPLAWFIRRITIKYVKTLIEDLQATVFDIRDG